MTQHSFCRPAQVMPGHQVGVDIVVSEGTILVRPGNTIYAELVSGSMKVTEGTPQACRLDEQFETHLLFKGCIASRRDVVGHSVGNVRIDMETCSSGRPIPRTFCSPNGSPRKGGSA